MCSHSSQPIRTSRAVVHGLLKKPMIFLQSGLKIASSPFISWLTQTSRKQSWRQLRSLQRLQHLVQLQPVLLTTTTLHLVSAVGNKT